MTTTATDPLPASPTAEPEPSSIALCVMTANVTSQIGVFNCEHAGFWFPDWQAAEREVDAEMATGRTRHFSSLEEFLEALEEDDDDEE